MRIPVDITYDCNFVSLANASSGSGTESPPNFMVDSNCVVRLTVIRDGNPASHPNYATLIDWRAGIGPSGGNALCTASDFCNTDDWAAANKSNAHISFRLDTEPMSAALGTSEAGEWRMTVSGRNVAGDQTVVATFPVIIRNLVDVDQSSSSESSESSVP